MAHVQDNVRCAGFDHTSCARYASAASFLGLAGAETRAHESAAVWNSEAAERLHRMSPSMETSSEATASLVRAMQ